MALAALIEPDHNCVDVGAHIGSLLAEIDRLAPRGSHVAFEPTPQKAQWLRRRFPRVEVIEAATWDEPGTALFHEDVDRPGLSGLREPVDDSTIRRHEVQVVTIDGTLGDRDRIDFLKIDVEGAELSTLRGAEHTVERHRPAILFECGTGTELERFGHTRADLFRHLVDRGYDVYSIIDFVYGRQPMTCESFDKAGTYPYRGFNYLALPRGTEVTRLL